MKLKRKFRVIILVLISIMTLTACTANNTAPRATKSVQVKNSYYADQLNLEAKSALAIDSQTGQILYGKNINQVMPIASMTKLVTVYLTLMAVKKGELKWTDTVQPTKAITKVAGNSAYSNVPLKQGHSYTVKQLYQATLIESANGAAMALAQKIAGSQRRFVDQMRKQLHNWGINDAKIYTTCGLPNKNVGTAAYPDESGSSENEMSAKDMALVSQHLLKNFPEVLKTTKIAHMNFTDGSKITVMTNFNWLLNGLSQHDPRFAVDGLKTGTTDAAGACLIATARHQGTRVITVVMGARHLNSSDPARFVQTKRLLAYLDQHYQRVILAKNKAIKSVNVKNGKQRKVTLGLTKQTAVWMPTASKNLKIRVVGNEITAPIFKGQKTAQLVFSAGKSNLPSLTSPGGVRAQAQSLKAVDKAGFFSRLFGGK